FRQKTNKALVACRRGVQSAIDLGIGNAADALLVWQVATPYAFDLARQQDGSIQENNKAVHSLAALASQFKRDEVASGLMFMTSAGIPDQTMFAETRIYYFEIEPMASESNTANPSSRKSCSMAGTKDKAAMSEETCVERIQPLLGKPYFACIMCKSHVRSPSLVPFPPPSTAPATLTSWCGRSWDMWFTGGRQIQRLEAGWRGFALDNGLRLGDGCVFELVDGAAEGGTVKFRVQVLHADIPAAIREKAGGYTSTSPIEID
ncbi:hypothetical protein EJB05_37454, partial [Eragrostis curvula]